MNGSEEEKAERLGEVEHSPYVKRGLTGRPALPLSQLSLSQPAPPAARTAVAAAHAIAGAGLRGVSAQALQAVVLRTCAKPDTEVRQVPKDEIKQPLSMHDQLKAVLAAKFSKAIGNGATPRSSLGGDEVDDEDWL
jgi:hypothetical protein